MNETAATSRKLPIASADLRFCVIGASSFLGAAADALLRAGLNVVAIASQSALQQPDEPTERYLASLGLHESVDTIVTRLGLPFVHARDPNTAASISAIKQTGANAVFSVSAPIIKPNFLDAFSGLVFNIHGSNRYRGRAGLSWLILNDDRLCADAWVLHWIDAGIDTGASIVEQRFIWPQTAYPIDIMSAQRAGLPALAASFAAAMSTGSITSTPQPTKRPYFPALKTAIDGKIDWKWTAGDIERCVRAFGWPYAGAATSVVSSDRQTTRDIQLARVRLGTADAMHPLACGVVLANTKGGTAEVACKDGSVIVETIRDGMGELPAGDVIRVGNRLN